MYIALNTIGNQSVQHLIHIRNIKCTCHFIQDEKIQCVHNTKYNIRNIKCTQHFIQNKKNSVHNTYTERENTSVPCTYRIGKQSVLTICTNEENTKCT